MPAGADGETAAQSRDRKRHAAAMQAAPRAKFARPDDPQHRFRPAQLQSPPFGPAKSALVCASRIIRVYFCILAILRLPTSSRLCWPGVNR
jgi:hypothetical protein